MNYIVCSIFDKVTGLYGDLKLFTNVSSAIRWFKGFENEKVFTDLQLFKLGTFNVESGDFSLEKEFLLNGYVKEG